MVPICATCGCGDPTHKHPGAASITWQQIEAAARDAEITPDQAVANMQDAAEQMEGAVLKARDEDRFLLMVIYSPHRMPLRGADGKKDLASPRVLEKACWRWMAKGTQTGMWHEDGHETDAVCVENSIYRGPDWDAYGDGSLVVKAGDWIAGFILSDHAWGLYKSGRVGGASMQGAAGRGAPTAESLARVSRRGYEASALAL